MQRNSQGLMTRRMLGLALVLTTLAGAAACDNPVDPPPHEEEAAGLSIRVGSAEIARYAGGQWTESSALPEVAAGEESALLTFVFLDDEGAPLDLSQEEDIYLRGLPANAAIAELEVTGYTGRIVGNAQGSTEITFDLMHGVAPGGHPDFSTSPLPVVIVP